MTTTTQPEEQTAPLASLLPTEKRPPGIAWHNTKGLIYGPPKIGKTTLAVNLAEDALVLACEPGLSGLSAYAVDITSWEKFLAVGKELNENRDQFSTIVVDTVDELYRLCSDHISKKLGIGNPADMEYGKAWAQVDDEFRLRVGGLTKLGRAVWFISHSKDVELKTNVGSITKTTPTLRPSAMKFLTGFCDFTLMAASQLTSDGEQRILRTRAAENFETGGRILLPDPLPLNAKTLRETIEKEAARVRGEKWTADQDTAEPAQQQTPPDEPQGEAKQPAKRKRRSAAGATAEAKEPVAA